MLHHVNFFLNFLAKSKFLLYKKRPNYLKIKQKKGLWALSYLVIHIKSLFLPS